MPAPGTSRRLIGRRPLGVVLLAAFGLVAGVQSILASFGVVGARAGSVGSLLTDPTEFKVVTLAFGLFFIAASIAIWMLLRAGWYATMLLSGGGLLLEIALYIYGTTNFVTMAVFVASAFYLNQREVKVLFLRPFSEQTAVALVREDEDEQ